MDPLTIGFESALHEANATGTPEDARMDRLIAELHRIVEASRHRVRAPVTISSEGDQQIVLRCGDSRCVLSLRADSWSVDGLDARHSGPVAAALTAWLTAGAITWRRR